MAVAFRSKSFAANTTTSLSVTEPAGAASGDILLAWFNVGIGATSIVVPSGWALVTGTNYSLSQSQGGLYWIRRGASAPSYAWSWTTSAYGELAVECYSGCETSGIPWNVVALATTSGAVNGTNPQSPAITTTVANTVAVALGMAWHGAGAGGYTAPTGYTGRELNTTAGQNTCAADKALATATTETPAAWGNTSAPGGNADVAGVTIALMVPQGVAAQPPEDWPTWLDAEPVDDFAEWPQFDPVGANAIVLAALPQPDAWPWDFPDDLSDAPEEWPFESATVPNANIGQIPGEWEWTEDAPVDDDWIGSLDLAQAAAAVVVPPLVDDTWDWTEAAVEDEGWPEEFPQTADPPADDEFWNEEPVDDEVWDEPRGIPTPQIGHVTFGWDAAGGSTVGYRIHYGTTQGGPYPFTVDVGNVTQYSVPGVFVGVVYFAVVGALDSGGTEGTLSAEAFGPGLPDVPLLQLDIDWDADAPLDDDWWHTDDADDGINDGAVASVPLVDDAWSWFDEDALDDDWPALVDDDDDAIQAAPVPVAQPVEDVWPWDDDLDDSWDAWDSAPAAVADQPADDPWSWDEEAVDEWWIDEIVGAAAPVLDGPALDDAWDWSADDLQADDFDAWPTPDFGLVNAPVLPALGLTDEWSDAWDDPATDEWWIDEQPVGANAIIIPAQPVAEEWGEWWDETPLDDWPDETPQSPPAPQPTGDEWWPWWDEYAEEWTDELGPVPAALLPAVAVPGDEWDWWSESADDLDLATLDAILSANGVVPTILGDGPIIRAERRWTLLTADARPTVIRAERRPTLIVADGRLPT